MKASNTVMSKKEQAGVWLETEQEAGFLKDCDITGALIDPNLFGKIEQLHTQAIAIKQAKISFKMGYNQALKDIRDGLSPSYMVVGSGSNL